MENKLEIKQNTNPPANQFEYYTHPHRLLSLLYQLELSTLSLLRISLSKNSLKPVIFQKSLDGQFNNIVLNFNEKTFCIKVQYVDTHYSQRCLDYNSFFSSIEGKFNIRKYLNEFAAELVKHSDSDALVPRYLILYTNANLNLTKSGKFKQTSDIFIPQMSLVTAKTDGNLHQFFKSSGQFYRFANDEETREFLEDSVTFNLQTRGKMQKKGFRPEEVRRVFFDRLILAVNQATLEEISDTVRKEMGKSDDSAKRGEVLAQLGKEGEEENIESCEYLRSMLYSFNLFLFYTHSMFLDETINSIRFEERGHSHTILMEVNHKFVQIKALEIDLKRLSLQKVKQGDLFSIESHLDSFQLEEVKKEPDYYVIYTNVDIALLRELIVGNNSNSPSGTTNCRKFTKINRDDPKYSVLRDLKFTNLYQLCDVGGKSTDQVPLVQKSDKEREQKNKKKKSFSTTNIELNKIVFATKQQGSEELYKTLENDIRKPKVPYDYEKLRKIVLFYLQSHEHDTLTKELMIEISDLAKKKRTGINVEVEFAKRVLTADMPEFGHFLDFLIKGNGKYYLDTLRRNDVKITSISKIIQGAKSHEVMKTFIDLCNVCIDPEGNRTNIVKHFEKKGLPIDFLSKILRSSGSNAAKTLQDLHDLWFDDSGNPTNYWKPLEKEAVIILIPLLFDNAGVDCVGRLKAFLDFWFHPTGTKTQCLKNLEDNGIGLPLICSVLIKSGEGCFREFYQLWFDESGKKTMRFKQLEKEGVTPRQVCKVLRRTGKNAIKAFDNLYSIWFDESGLKTHYSLTLTAENVHFSHIVDILRKTGINALGIFKDLYVHWFQDDGSKTKYLKILEAKGIDVPKVCKHLSAAGPQSIDKFKTLVNSYDPQCQWNIKTQTPAREEVTGDKILKTDIKTEKPKKKEQEENTVLMNLKKMKIQSGESSKKEQKGEKGSTLDAENKDTILSETVNNYESSDGKTITFKVSKLHHKNEIKFVKFFNFDEKSLQFAGLIYFLINEDGKKYLNVFQNNGILLKNLTPIFQGVTSPIKIIQSFRELYTLWFNEDGKMNSCLQVLGREKVKLSDIITILHGSGIFAAEAFENLHHLWFDPTGKKTCYLRNFEKNQLSATNISLVFRESGFYAAENIKEFHDIFFDSNGGKTECLNILEREKVHLQEVFKILKATGDEAKETFQGLYDFWFDSLGKKTKFLMNLEEAKIHLPLIVKLLAKSGKSAPAVFENIYNFIFDDMGSKQYCIRNLEKDVEIHALFNIINGSIFDAKYLKTLYDFWYNSKGKKTKVLLTLEESGVNLNLILKLLKGTDSQASAIFNDLVKFLFDKQGNKTKEMKNIEKVIELRIMFEMIVGAKEKAYKTFVELYKLWFDKKGNKTNELLILEKNKMSLMDVSKKLSAEAGGKIVEKFKTFFTSLSKKNKQDDVFKRFLHYQ